MIYKENITIPTRTRAIVIGTGIVRRIIPLDIIIKPLLHNSKSRNQYK
jgi:hypothetical protein